MKDFQKYWKGDSVPRCLTLFVGGNHEAPGHLREMYFGGYASEGIFYLGSSGVFHVNGLRIAGISGIYKSHDYDKPIFESAPYSESTKRSAYHVRRYEIEKLMHLRQPVDIVVSHDWPSGITDHGDTDTLLRLKDKTGQLRREIDSKQLGNPHTMKLLQKLKPKFWFAGHMHVKYPAIYTHEDGSITRFLALDKCIPRRPFLQLLRVDIDSKSLVDIVPSDISGDGGLKSVGLDAEWLALLKANNAAMPIPGNNQGRTPIRGVSDEEIDEMKQLLESQRASHIPYLGQTFPGDPKYRKWICSLIGMKDMLEEVQLPNFSKIEGEAKSGDLFFED